MMDLFKIGFLSITLIDILDIAIVGALFFWVYRSLRGTFAVQILFGLIVIIILSFITEAVNLKSTNWILKTISSIWLLAFIILFQPELRRMLILMTRTKIFRLFVKSQISITIDVIIEAILELSEKHIGALIVFTRGQNVEMTVETGVQLHAIVSKELLISIFNTKSPLHDGAVIIQNQVIIAARCVLPLSTTTKYGNKALGTRHRAGLGLSEHSDSLILIVSEETGGITIAQEGRMFIDIPRKEFGNIFRQKMSGKD